MKLIEFSSTMNISNSKNIGFKDFFNTNQGYEVEDLKSNRDLIDKSKPKDI